MTEEFDDSQYVTLEEAKEMIVASEKEIQDLVKKKSFGERWSETSSRFTVPTLRHLTKRN
jgi:hypothetical protein